MGSTSIRVSLNSISELCLFKVGFRLVRFSLDLKLLQGLFMGSWLISARFKVYSSLVYGFLRLLEDSLRVEAASMNCCSRSHEIKHTYRTLKAN